MHRPDAVKPRGGATIALWIVAVIAIGFVLRVLAPILVPFVLAVFLLLLVTAVAGFVKRVFPSLPDWTGTAAGVLAVLLFFVASVLIVADQAGSVAAQSSRIVSRVEGLIATVARAVGAEPVSLRTVADGPWLQSLAGSVFRSLQGFAGGLILVVIYLGFLLASRTQLRAKLSVLFPDQERRGRAEEVFHTVARGTQEYMWVQTVTGLMIAGASWLVMILVGQDNAALLALIIFLTSYIPVMGPLFGVTIPALFGLVQFDGLREPLILLASLQAINFVINNLLTPKMQADRLNLDPVVVLLGLGLWSFIWGLPGGLLSVPLMVMIMALATALPKLRWLAVLLSKDGRIEIGRARGGIASKTNG